MAYGIVLLFDDAVAAVIIEYAATMTAGSSRQMVLGAAAPPHITLAHADCERNVALDWWRRCAGALPVSMRVRVSGVMVSAVPEGDYYVPEGGLYLGLEVLKRPELERHHRVVAGAARDLGAAPIGAVDDDFRPHVTLAVLRPTAVTVTPPPDVVLDPAGPVRLALGRLGPFGTVPEILAVAGRSTAAGRPVIAPPPSPDGFFGGPR